MQFNQMKNELKAKYKQDFKKISFLVNEIDLCGLIKGGAHLMNMTV